MKMKERYMRLIIIGMVLFWCLPLLSGVNTQLVFVSNLFNTPSPGLGTLVIDVQAKSMDGISYSTRTFQDAFELDDALRGQSPSVSFTNQLFPSSGYTTTEDYTSSDPNAGRIRYVYTYDSGTFSSITTDWTRVVTISIQYTMTNSNTSIAWTTFSPDYYVTDSGNNLRTGSEETIASTLKDISLPVQMGQMEATAIPGEGINLGWRTESEANSAGFHIWRSDSEKGTYKRVTTALIASTGRGSSATEYEFVDKNIQDGNKYWYKIEELSTEGKSEFFGPISVQGVPLPTEYKLSQNYPNPFNPETTIKYELPEVSEVSVNVYTLLGKNVKTLVNKIQNAGRYTVNWNAVGEDGKRVPSGVYFIRIQAETFSQIRKMMFIQ